MFRKLLKYDMRAVGKFWWIAALVSTVLSVLGGFCITIMRANYTTYTYLQGLAFFGIVLVVMAYGAFALTSMVLIFVRFYKNFFSDEGYLTFTLPVKRSELILSKLVCSVIYEVLSAVIILLDVVGMICIGFADEIFTKEFFRSISNIIDDIIGKLGGYFAVYSVEIILAFLLVSISSMMGIFVCITLASTIAKKHKVLTALGFYYAYSVVVSSIMQTFMFNGVLTRIVERLVELPENEVKFVFFVMLLGGCAFVAVVAAAFYIFEHYLLRRRLNLD